MPVLLLCLLSAPLLGAWMRWVELPRLVREADLQPCAEAAATLSGGTAGIRDAATDAMVEALDAQETALAPRHCIGMRRIDTGTGLRTAAYRFADGSQFTLHLRAPPAAPPRGGTGIDTTAQVATDTASNTTTGSAADDAGMRTGTPGGTARSHTGAPADAAPAPSDPAPTATPPAQPVPRPILAASCPTQSRQSLLVLAGLLLVGVVVVLHRLRAGGKFLDFRNVVREPLRPGEVLLLIYAFTVMAGTGLGLQFGGCEAAEHRDTVQAEQTPITLNGLMVPAAR